eukprot:gnl/TRDRNA2_/TRDRNA2_193557_c0_seq1.p1 gnl/TRDRNA2_/TRDRNA2_193557_c0~~gnl/TRDRNA2_/TRDRNA2_193557_c0_seq1.p1  ORF type:complete len:594 (-),score=61.57 gnl/TRDRNA2_/TRDRNA2_193557_c0_seq1:116-1897(-)
MWARRLGAPHLCPSRVKVFFLASLTGIFIFSVFQYLHSANVAYLELTKPVSRDIVCKLPREECRGSADVVKCTAAAEDGHFWFGLNLSDPCPALPASLSGQTCENPSLPLSSVAGELSGLHTVNSQVNPFKLWSKLFVVLTSLLTVCIVIHDMALLDESLRPRILSMPSMRYATPRLWEWLTALFGKRCRGCMARLWMHSRILWILVVPLWFLLQAVFFMGVMYPMSLLVFFVVPVRMSRIMVFLSGILCILWSVIFITVAAVFDNQVYAVLWGVSDADITDSCVCLCEYPLNHFVVVRLVTLGLGVCWHSFNLTFRALKGLRRGQWANMFSVLYAVPIEAFPVVWERPPEAGGGPVQWRTEGEPVQSEPAFDPFCLMDEQPESAWTRPQILPATQSEEQLMIWEPYTGTLEVEIGCCGFPRPLGVGEARTGHSPPHARTRSDDFLDIGEETAIDGGGKKVFDGTPGRPPTFSVRRATRAAELECEPLSHFRVESPLSWWSGSPSSQWSETKLPISAVDVGANGHRTYSTEATDAETGHSHNVGNGSILLDVDGISSGEVVLTRTRSNARLSSNSSGGGGDVPAPQVVGAGMY